jgi:hypothetical protein
LEEIVVMLRHHALCGPILFILILDEADLTGAAPRMLHDIIQEFNPAWICVGAETLSDTRDLVEC